MAASAVQTPLSGVVIDDALTHTYEAQGHDMHTLLFAFLDELLFVFSTELFVPRCACLPFPVELAVGCARSLPHHPPCHSSTVGPVGTAPSQHHLA